MIVKTYEEIFGKKLTIRDLIDGFEEDTKSGSVVAFGGKLNVRPPYQREFVYEEDKKKAVINTVLNGYPLNVMYWALSDDGNYELMDGQQRTISLCKFAQDQFSVEILDATGKRIPKTFSSLGSKKDDVLDYPLTIYICDGNDEEKLAWFQVINIAGVKLTEQEMRNAIYNSAWVTNAKKYFSRTDGLGYLSEGNVSTGHTYGDYVNVVGGEKSEKENAIVRQKLLEIVLGWAVHRENMLYGKNETIDDYMEEHKKEPDARKLWRYYEDVMEWVKTTFPTYRDIMKAVEWGELYNEFEGLEPDDADEQANALFAMSDELSNKKEIYRAVLSGDMKLLNARKFDKKDTAWAYKEQHGICPYCKEHFDEKDMHGDHIKPWSKGGTTTRDNLQMLCTACNIKKSNHDVKHNSFYSNTDYKEFNLEEWDSQNNE